MSSLSSNQQGKLKLAVSLDDPNARAALKCFAEGKKIDADSLLRASQERLLTDADKARYIVIKFAFLIYDESRKRVAIFSREPEQHSNNVSPVSILLASGLDSKLAIYKTPHALIINELFPFTLKLGALVTEFEIEAVKYDDFQTAQKFSSFVFRKNNDRYYAFFVHKAYLKKGSRFPINEFELVNSKDWFRGFRSPESIKDELNQTDLLVDRTVLAKILRENAPREVSSHDFVASSRLRRIRNYWSVDRIKLAIAVLGIAITFGKVAQYLYTKTKQQSVPESTAETKAASEDKVLSDNSPKK